METDNLVGISTHNKTKKIQKRKRQAHHTTENNTYRAHLMERQYVTKIGGILEILHKQNLKMFSDSQVKMRVACQLTNGTGKAGGLSVRSGNTILTASVPKK